MLIKKLLLCPMMSLILLFVLTFNVFSDYTEAEKIAIAKKLNAYTFLSNENTLLKQDISDYKSIMLSQSNYIELQKSIDKVKEDEQKKNANKSFWTIILLDIIFVAGALFGKSIQK